MINQSCYELGTAPSVIRALFMYGLEKAKEVGAENVYDYSMGNPSIPAPAKVNDTIVEMATKTDSIKLHGYSVAAGFEDARAAVAADLAKRYGMDITASDLFFTCGAAPALCSVLKALTVDAETEFVIVAPFFPEYKVFIGAAGAKAVVVEPDYDAFQINLEELKAKITAKTQGVIINSPNNPSGVIYSAETLDKVSALLSEKEKEVGHPIYLIADEPYRELAYDGKVTPFVPQHNKNTIVCYSWSKSLSLPGERIGYVFVPKECTDADKISFAVAGAARAIGHVCPPTLMQRVVEHCVTEAPDLKAYDENRKLLYDSLTEMGYECVKPEGAFYLMIKAPGGDANAFSEKAKLTQNILIVPCDGFGCPGYLRLAYCVSNEMIKRSLPGFKALIA